jgi:hypothetical protein
MYNQRQTRWFGQRKRSRRVTKRTLAPKLEELNRIASKEIYSPPLREGMFRLVTLCAGSQSERIRCKLTESPLESPTPYNALSYVWGSRRDPGRILLDSQEYLVTRNLFEALKELRLPDSDKVLWVDALCINQSDIAERSAQVILMDSVYKKATRVIAWLGPHENDSALTFELLQKVELSGGGGPYLLFQGLRGLPPLLAREYWSRAWIIQEMEFARELRIRCGPDEALYSTLFKLKNSLLESTSVISELKAPARDLRFNRNVSVQRSFPSVFPKQIPELGLARSGQSLSPVIYLDRLIHSKCSNRHDSVLAFYNLFSVEIRTQIESYKQGGFYEMPPDKFLIQAMRAIIEVTQNLYILTVKARQLGPNIEELWQRDMPSWCPYFGTSFKSVSIPHANDISFGTATKPINFLDDGKTLRASGFRIGTISRTVRRDSRSIGQFQPLSNENDITKELEYIHKCMDFVSSLSGKAGGDGEAKEEALEAIRQTLLAGEDTDALRELLHKVKKIDDNERFKYENLGARCEHALNEVKKYTHTRVICSFTVTPTLQYNSDIHVALVPDTVRRGDVICYVVGCNIPIVLHPVGGRYEVLGEAFVQELVDEENLRCINMNSRESEEFIIQ